MRHEGDTVIATQEDAATLRQIADEYGMAPRLVEQLLELGCGDDVELDEVLRPVVATIYRLQLEAAGAVRR